MSAEKRLRIDEESGSTEFQAMLLPRAVTGLGANGSESNERKRKLFIVFISEICAIQCVEVMAETWCKIF